MTPHDLTVKARNLIDREGWAQCRFEPSSRGEGYCALGALTEVGIEAGLRGAELTAVKDEIALILFPQAGSVARGMLMGWNDASARTKKEVLAAFDKAIAATAPAPDFASLEPSKTPELVA